MKKFFSEPRPFKDHLDFMAEGAGCDGQGVGGGGLTHEFAHPGENDQMILYRFQIGMRFPSHQLRDGRLGQWGAGAR